MFLFYVFKGKILKLLMFMKIGSHWASIGSTNSDK